MMVFKNGNCMYTQNSIDSVDNYIQRQLQQAGWNFIRTVTPNLRIFSIRHPSGPQVITLIGVTNQPVCIVLASGI